MDFSPSTVVLSLVSSPTARKQRTPNDFFFWWARLQPLFVAGDNTQVTVPQDQGARQFGSEELRNGLGDGEQNSLKKRKLKNNEWVNQ